MRPLGWPRFAGIALYSSRIYLEIKIVIENLQIISAFVFFIFEGGRRTEIQLFVRAHRAHWYTDNKKLTGEMRWMRITLNGNSLFCSCNEWKWLCADSIVCGCGNVWSAFHNFEYAIIFHRNEFRKCVAIITAIHNQMNGSYISMNLEFSFHITRNRVHLYGGVCNCRIWV